MVGNELKQFVFIFSLGGNKLEWSGDQIGPLLERAHGTEERDQLRKWMENCKIGGFLMLGGGAALCVGMDPAKNGNPPGYFADEGHGVTDKSKAAFLLHRKAIGPVERIEVRQDTDAIITKVLVVGKNGSQMGLTGFGVGRGSGGTGRSGFKWLLDMCGMRYDEADIDTVDLEVFNVVVFNSMRQTANHLSLISWGTADDPWWEAVVRVERANGDDLKLCYPEDTSRNLYSDVGELIDLVLQDITLRGIEWTADPRIGKGYQSDGTTDRWYPEIDNILQEQSIRIGWNHTVEEAANAESAR